jgi:hypothetical protein
VVKCLYKKEDFPLKFSSFTLHRRITSSSTPTLSKQHHPGSRNTAFIMFANFKLLTFFLAGCIQTHLSLAVPVENPNVAHNPKTALHTCAIL